jgi:hypothetical protein
MSVAGQNEKYSERVEVFRSCTNNRHFRRKGRFSFLIQYSANTLFEQPPAPATRRLRMNGCFAPEAVIGAESAFDPQQTTNVIRLSRPSDSNRRRPKRSIRAYFQPTPTLLVPSSNIVAIYFRLPAKVDDPATGREAP